MGNEGNLYFFFYSGDWHCVTLLGDFHPLLLAHYSVGTGSKDAGCRGMVHMARPLRKQLSTIPRAA